MQVNETQLETIPAITLRVPRLQVTPLIGLLIKMKLKKASHDFTINALSLGVCMRISSLLLDINPEGLSDNDKLLQATHSLVTNHSKTITYIIALAIRNSAGEPPKWLLRYLRNNLSISDMSQALNIAVRQMQLMSFIEAVVTVKGLNILSIEPN